VPSVVARNLLQTVLIALAYYCGARLGFAFAVGGSVALWPPSGLMLGVLALSPPARWPWLIGGALAGSLASDLSSGYTLPLAIFAAAANAFDSAVGAWVLRRVLGTPIQFSSLRAVVVLGLGVVIATNAITAIPGAIMLTVGWGSGLLGNWFLWWAGDGLGMLIVTPVILTWNEAIRRRQRLRRTQVVEAVLLLGCLLTAAPVVLGPAHALVPSGPYLLFPLMLWAGLRFGAVGAATATLIVAAVAIWHTSLMQGPFVNIAEGAASAVRETYAFLAVVGISSLIVATTLQERQEALAQLRHSQDEKRASDEARRRLEEQYRQSQKMEAVGELAGGIAHDFNNLLTVVLANTEMLLDDVGPGSPLQPQLEQVHAAGQRAAALTRQLLAFSRRQILEPRVVSLADIVVGIEPMLKRLIGEHVTVKVSVPAPVGPVVADPGQIEQVILNLSINARDAMPSGGILTIDVSERELDPGDAPSVDLPPGRYATLSVMDTGSGIVPDAIGRIFDPFFTTKPVGRGTGLGLSTVHGIVKQSGGGIEVSSQLNRGSVFRVYLPLVEAEVEVEMPAPAAIPVEPRKATILIVEDEPSVGKLTRRIVERGGYRALLAGTPSEALGIASAEPNIQMLLTDVVLPEMSGRALAGRLRATHPDLHVLYMSGYSDDALSQHGVLDPGIALIEKPFRGVALLGRIEALLRGDAHASAKLGAGEAAS
jgi:signal transduction histidine kinase/CheY-like chemotaxis protein